jgi:glucose/arabinose dehydrogenase/PKD repeat protein
MLHRWVCAVLLSTASAAYALTLPDGFVESQIAGGLASPVSLQFAPDGRVFICEQAGKIRIVKNGQLLADSFLELAVDANGDRGLQSICFDPDFASNNFVYVVYTSATAPAHNIVSRFTASGDTALAASELKLLDLTNFSTSAHHCCSTIDFGPDGKLYIGTADNSTGANAQSFTSLLGKILRINADGTIPADNPFTGSTSDEFRAIWAMGLRNPFTFSFQRGTGRLLINDVGDSTSEEINEGAAGINYGWPATEGWTSDSRFRPPLYGYSHGTGPTSGCAITGGTFYNPVTNQFPAQYVGSYFFIDYCTAWIRRIDLNNGNAITGFAAGISGNPINLRTSKDGSLYFLSRAKNALMRIQYAPALAPVITQHPVNQTAFATDNASFMVSSGGSAPLTYQWQREGVDIAGATDATYTLTGATLADDGAHFRCRVTNAYGSALSNHMILTVVQDQPPAATIVSPAEGALYTAGETFTFSGTATDPDDGTPPASAYIWKIDLFRTEHVRPFVPPESGFTSGMFTPPTVGQPDADIAYRISLTVTDTRGASHTVTRDVFPRLARISLQTVPAGFNVLLDGHPHFAPYDVTGVVGFVRTIEAPAVQMRDGEIYDFVGWSDNGEREHQIATPSSNTTYVAIYAARPGPSISGPVASPMIAEQGDEIEFSATAFGNGPLDWKWTFDDGFVSTAADTVRHAFSSVGRHRVSLSVIDVDGLSQTQSAEVTIVTADVDGDGIPNKVDSDLDGDGVLNDVEIADGTDPTSAASVFRRPIVVSKMSAALKFSTGHSDALALSIQIPDLPSFDLAGTTLSLNIGGAKFDCVLDAKGRTALPDGKLSAKFLKMRGGKGSALGLTLSVRNCDLCSCWHDEGVYPAAAAHTLGFSIDLAMNGRIYAAQVNGKFSGTPGKTGRFKK